VIDAAPQDKCSGDIRGWIDNDTVLCASGGEFSRLHPTTDDLQDILPATDRKNLAMVVSRDGRKSRSAAGVLAVHASASERKNSAQVLAARSDAGSTPASVKICHTAEAATLMPRTSSSL
jgi:hypothetical protein